jgi:hypothetical protein
MEAQPASENSYVFNKTGKTENMLTCLTANVNVLYTITAQALEILRFVLLSRGF